LKQDAGSYATTSDLSNYATTAALNTMPNSLGLLASTNYIDNNFTKTTDLPVIPDVSGFITSAALPDVSGFITTADLPYVSGFITSAALPDVSGFITSAALPDVSGYITSADLPDLTTLIEKPVDFTTLENYIISKAPTVDNSDNITYTSYKDSLIKQDFHAQLIPYKFIYDEIEVIKLYKTIGGVETTYPLSYLNAATPLYFNDYKSLLSNLYEDLLTVYGEMATVSGYTIDDNLQTNSSLTFKVYGSFDSTMGNYALNIEHKTRF
jgi:hypothetical protein